MKSTKAVAVNIHAESPELRAGASSAKAWPGKQIASKVKKAINDCDRNLIFIYFSPSNS
jgi:hypothetical protein